MPRGYDRVMMRRRLLPAALILLGSCTLPSVVERLGRESPSPELGRPVWVRGPAWVGSWIGGALGGLASIITLPVTWPLSQLGEDTLGGDRQEFVWGLTSVGASAGHTIVGAPLDGLDWIFRRAWVDDPSPARERFEAQSGPVGPTERREVVETPAISEPPPSRPEAGNAADEGPERHDPEPQEPERPDPERPDPERHDPERHDPSSERATRGRRRDG